MTDRMLFRLARNFPPTDVAAAEAAREIELVDRGIGARLRFGHALARRGDAQHAAAGGDEGAIVARGAGVEDAHAARFRSEEHTSELQSLMRISYAVFCLQKKTTNTLL